MKQKKQLEVTIAVSAHSEENLIKKKYIYIYIYIYIYMYIHPFTPSFFYIYIYIYIYRERKLWETQHWTTSRENCNVPERDLNPRPPDH